MERCRPATRRRFGTLLIVRRQFTFRDMNIVLVVAALVVGLPLLLLLVAAIDGFSNRFRKPRLTAAELADQIELLINEEEWGHRDVYDELVCVPINASPLERYRERVVKMRDRATSTQSTWFTQEQKVELRAMIDELRASSAA